MLSKRDIETLLIDEPGYHHSFYTLKPKPRLLYVLGNKSVLDKKILGVVGPRQASVYSDQVMRDLFVSVAEYDLVTISGGARGVDTQCHELSLQYNIPTIVVLGAGFDHYLQHPRTKELLDRVVQVGWLLLSQFEHDFEPTVRSYPTRNKIIAGLSRVLFVPAAGEKSWSLLTVKDALEFGKPVYSVPNSIYDATSFGTNIYIQERKIQPVCFFDPMLGRYFEKKGAIEQTEPVSLELTIEEQQLVQLLAEAPTEISALCEKLQRPIEKVLGSITGLEIQWLIEQSQVGTYKLV